MKMWKIDSSTRPAIRVLNLKSPGQFYLNFQLGALATHYEHLAEEAAAAKQLRSKVKSKAEKLEMINGYPIFAYAPHVIKIKSLGLLSVKLKNTITNEIIATYKKAFKKQADADVYIRHLRAKGARADELAKMDNALITSFLSAYDLHISSISNAQIPGDLFDWQAAVIDAGLEVVTLGYRNYAAVIPAEIQKAMILTQLNKPNVFLNLQTFHLHLENNRIECGYYKNETTLSGKSRVISVLGRAFINRDIKDVK